MLGNIINQFKSARFCARKLQILNTLETVAHLIFKTGIYIPAVSTITEKPFNQISFRHFIIKNFNHNGLSKAALFKKITPSNIFFIYTNLEAVCA